MLCTVRYKHKSLQCAVVSATLGKQVGVRLQQSFELKQFSVTIRRKEVGKLFQSHAAMSQYCNFVIKRLNVKRARSTVFWFDTARQHAPATVKFGTPVYQALKTPKRYIPNIAAV